MKKELIEKIMSRTHPTQHIAYIGKGFLQQILSEELPDFQRIDWVRLRDCFEKVSHGYISSHLSSAVKEYNSTLPTALKPLPKEMPKDLTRFAMGHDVDEVWDKIISEYGTPANNLQPLPSVEKLEKELFDIYRNHSMASVVTFKMAQHMIQHYGTPAKPNLPTVEELMDQMFVVYKIYGNDLRSVVEHLHEKYSLPTREWWQDCEKFMHKGIAYKKYSHQVYPDGRTFLHSELSRHDLQDCTPYTHPTADDIIAKHNLTEEEVKAIREGKDGK